MMWSELSKFSLFLSLHNFFCLCYFLLLLFFFSFLSLMFSFHFYFHTLSMSENTLNISRKKALPRSLVFKIFEPVAYGFVYLCSGLTSCSDCYLI